MEPAELQSRRTAIGVLALVLLSLSGVVFWVAPEKTGTMGALLRVGVLLSAFWLAIPQLMAKPRLLKYLPWYLLGGLILGVVFIKYIFILIPAFLALAVLTMFAGKKRPDARN